MSLLLILSSPFERLVGEWVVVKGIENFDFWNPSQLERKSEETDGWWPSHLLHVVAI
jgi:hypothetical protein